MKGMDSWYITYNIPQRLPFFRFAVKRPHGFPKER